jgi:ADP-ribosylglycohydrolase
MEKVEPIKLKDCLLSAAIGDICGSPWEFAPFKGLTLEGFRKSIKFDYSDPNNNGYSPLLEHCNMEILRLPHPPYATDDSICTFAIAEAVINGTDIEKNLVSRCLDEINRGYGPMFVKWLMNENRKPYNSYGNGSAMRCSIAGWYASSIDEVKEIAEATAAPSHNHPEGIKGAVAAARAIYRARKGWSKEDVADGIFDYYPDFWRTMTWDEILEKYRFDVTCQGSLPVVAMAVRDSKDFEDCILRCIQSGGDCDTLGAIAAPIAYAIHREIPDYMLEAARKYLPKWCLDINEKFNRMNGF